MLLAWLGEEYEYQEVNIHKGETKTSEFLAINPAGQIPALVLDDGRVLAESNAILFYLALGTPYLPPTAYAQAQTLRWMFFEQYKHEPNIAVARFISLYAPKRKKQLPELLEKGNAALAIMETYLVETKYFGGDDGPSIADIALYAYTHVADEGGFDLSSYPKIRGWLSRIKKHKKAPKITDVPS